MQVNSEKLSLQSKRQKEILTKHIEEMSWTHVFGWFRWTRCLYSILECSLKEVGAMTETIAVVGDKLQASQDFLWNQYGIGVNDSLMTFEHSPSQWSSTEKTKKLWWELQRLRAWMFAYLMTGYDAVVLARQKYRRRHRWERLQIRLSCLNRSQQVWGKCWMSKWMLRGLLIFTLTHRCLNCSRSTCERVWANARGWFQFH